MFFCFSAKKKYIYIKKQPQHGVTLMSPECGTYRPSELACAEWNDHLPSNKDTSSLVRPIPSDLHLLVPKIRT